jgi:hypothetical protein
LAIFIISYSVSYLSFEKKVKKGKFDGEQGLQHFSRHNPSLLKNFFDILLFWYFTANPYY